MRKIRHLLPNELLSKSKLCKHEDGCFENFIADALKRFIFGFALQMTLKNISLIVRPTKLIKNL